MLIICDQAENENVPLKPKRPLDVIGMTVSADVNAFTPDVHLRASARFPSSSRNNFINPDNGLSIDVPCVKKVFRFYSR